MSKSTVKKASSSKGSQKAFASKRSTSGRRGGGGGTRGTAGAAVLAAFNSTQGIVEITPTGTIVSANDRLLALLGYSSDQLCGQKHSNLIEGEHRQSAVYRNYWDALGRGEATESLHGCLAKDGRKLWLLATAAPVRDSKGAVSHIVESLLDVTALQTELEEVREELDIRTRIMNETSIVSESDLKGDIISINEKFTEVSKYSRNELIGAPHNTTRHPDMPKETFKALWQTIGRGNVFRGVIKNRAKDGTPYYVDAVIAPLMGKNGKPRKYLGVRYDITKSETERHNMKGILDAINRSYAMIEFDLQGNVIAANDVFLQAMGYRLEEVKGRHHSQFVDQATRQSADYKQFWERLGRAEVEAGQYRRLTKSGQEIWLQASYNPVCDEMGRPFKIVKIASDVTAQVRGATMLKEAVASTRQVVTAAGENDLTQRVSLQGMSGEIVELCEGVNGLLDTMCRTVRNVSIAAGEVTAAVTEITMGVNDLSQRTEQQASSLEETAASMEEMASTVKQNADNAAQANQLAINSRTVATEGGAIVGKAVEAMSRIDSSSQKISDIIGVIDEIAFQTNLLALNAAVEAARAGDAGKGFAVVAQEVRSLAQRSSGAAKDIKSLINQSSAQVKEGVKLVNDTGNSLNQIVDSIKKVTDIVSEIAAASREQSTGVEEINKAVAQMDEMTQKNSALVEESAAASRTLQEQAQELRERMAVFNTGSDGPVVPSRSGISARRSKEAAPVDRLQRTAELAPKRHTTPTRALVSKVANVGGAAALQAQLQSSFDADGEWSEF